MSDLVSLRGLATARKTAIGSESSVDFPCFGGVEVGFIRKVGRVFEDRA